MTYVLPPLSSPRHDSLRRPEQRGKAWLWHLELVWDGTKASLGCSVWGSQALKQLSPGGVLEVQTQEAKGQHQFLEANTGLKGSAEAGMKWNQAGMGSRRVLGVSKKSWSALTSCYPLEATWHTQKKGDTSFYTFFISQALIFIVISSDSCM